MSIKARALIALALTAAFTWSYWPTLGDLIAFWGANEDYSSGQFIPLIVGYVLWCRRGELARTKISTCWAGLGLLALAQGMRFYGTYDMYGSLERYSVVLSIVGLVWFLLGTAFVLRCKWILIFLFVAMPLPGRVHNTVSPPLQEFATRSAVVGLEMFGQLVQREGNTLRMSDQNVIAVAEACNGLRMLNAFVVVCATLAFIVRRPFWHKAFVVVSSIPIAMLSNTLRLIATVVVFQHLGSETAETFFHDFAGLTMMPLAIAMVAAELKLLDWLAGPPYAPAKPAKDSPRRPHLAGLQLKHAVKY